MGIRTITGSYDGGSERAVMIDSVTGWAFGPMFDSAEDVDAFVAYVREHADVDARLLDDVELSALHACWLDESRLVTADVTPAEVVAMREACANDRVAR